MFLLQDDYCPNRDDMEMVWFFRSRVPSLGRKRKEFYHRARLARARRFEASDCARAGGGSRIVALDAPWAAHRQNIPSIVTFAITVVSRQGDKRRVMATAMKYLITQLGCYIGGNQEYHPISPLRLDPECAQSWQQTGHFFHFFHKTQVNHEQKIRST